MKELVKRILLKPPHVTWCSQTIYQALLGCIKLYEASTDVKWKTRALHLCGILKKIQCEDGGFDIAYDFNFGMLHRKGESTSPEMIGLLAFVEYGRVFGFDEELKEHCDSAVEWILRNSKWEDELCYVPYAPHSTSSIMVYNGTSFAAGALGYYLGILGSTDANIAKTYHGMVKYLDSVMLRSHTIPNGRYWPYNDQKRTDIGVEKLNKIDHYHQMQQVESHSYGQMVAPHELQTTMIVDAVDYVSRVFEDNGYLPYTNNSADFKGLVHVWGLSSTISGVLMCQKVTGETRSQWVSMLEYVVDFLINKSWNGKFFCPVLDKNGIPRSSVYMVRSDAWVFNSLAGLMLSKEVFQSDPKILGPILDKCYDLMEMVNFSGPESHASTRRSRFISSIAKRIL